MIGLSAPQLTSLLCTLPADRTAFIWGPPGVGKSALVRAAAAALELPCITLLGTQLAPEDLIGVPRIRVLPGDRHATEFCPPRTLLRDAPFLLFIDELNSAVPDVQKAFYSLILDRRLGEYALPMGSRVVGAGNRGEDRALVRPMATALANRMVHVALQPSAEAWLAWAASTGVSATIMAFIRSHPARLCESPPTDGTPAYPTPRAWHLLSDSIATVPEALWPAVAIGCVGDRAGTEFAAFARRAREVPSLGELASGSRALPEAPDLVYFAGLSCLSALAQDQAQAGEDAARALVKIAERSREIAVWVLDMAFRKPLPTAAFEHFDQLIRSDAAAMVAELVRLERFRRQ